MSLSIYLFARVRLPVVGAAHLPLASISSISRTLPAKCLISAPCLALLVEVTMLGWAKRQMDAARAS